MAKVGVIGAGSWGTALAVNVAKAGHEVILWSAVASEMELLRTEREHTERLKGVKLPDNIYIEDDIEKACTDMDQADNQHRRTSFIVPYVIHCGQFLSHVHNLLCCL